uniref:Uncharacterized protein n=1 Tax=Ditylenchus dipsaci TaxID=166011 RepID=A0A915E195_9BILA
MTASVASILEAERAIIDSEFKMEMKELFSAVCKVLKGRSLDEVLALGVGLIKGPSASKKSVRQAGIVLNFEESLKSAHRNHWHEPRSSHEELEYFKSMEWSTKGKNDLKENVFSAGTNHPLINDIIKKASKRGSLQNLFFVVHNYFNREDSDEEDNSDEDESEESSNFNHLCGQPYLTTYLAECRFIALPAFGGALEKHALLYTDKEVS